MNSPWSYLGLPTVNFPLSLDRDGMPLGVQLVARPGEEDSLFRAALWCEKQWCEKLWRSRGRVMGGAGESWNWTAPRQVVFGWGRRAELGSLLKTQARRVSLIPGSRTLVASPIWREILDDLAANSIEVEQLPIISRTADGGCRSEGD